MSTIDFKPQIEEIIESTVDNKFAFFSEKYKETFTRYPKLMKLACETADKESFYSRFRYFMDMKQTIQTNELSHEQADILVGQHLADEYLPKK
jgi:hypothetical protein